MLGVIEIGGTHYLRHFQRLRVVVRFSPQTNVFRFKKEMSLKAMSYSDHFGTCDCDSPECKVERAVRRAAAG
jgi:hypothetical protein